MTSDEIKRRALALSEKTNRDTITPTEVGGIMYDTVGYMEDVERNGASLGIRKTYATVSAMEADLNPVGDDGSPLKKGMLVNIYDQDTPDSPDNGKVFSFQAPGWAFRTKIDAGYATKEELSELENKIYQNPNANDNTKLICAAIKEMYIIDSSEEWKLTTIGRNVVSGTSETGWTLKIYNKDLSKNVNYNTKENPEGDSGLQLVVTDGFIALVDWNKLPDGYYKTSMVTDDYLLDKKCFDLKYSPIISINEANINIASLGKETRLLSNGCLNLLYFSEIKTGYYNAEGTLITDNPSAGYVEFAAKYLGGEVVYNGYGKARLLVYNKEMSIIGVYTKGSYDILSLHTDAYLVRFSAEKSKMSDISLNYIPYKIVLENKDEIDNTNKILDNSITVINNKIYQNPNANDFTKQICKAVKELYIPYDGKDWVLAVIGRNSDATEKGWIFKLYTKDLSKNISYISEENPEGNSGLQLIEKNGMYALIDWNELSDGFYKTSMTGNDYLLDKKCFDLNNSPVILAFKGTKNYNITWNLPNNITVLSTYIFTYYEDTLIKNYEMLRDKVFFKVESDSSDKKIYDGLGKILCDGTYIKFSAYIDGDIVSEHTISVERQNEQTGLSKKCLFITDSYGDNTYGTDGMIGWVQKIATENGNTVIPVGTRTNEYGKLGETYQGWAESTFFRYIPTTTRDDVNTRQPSNVSSPFMFSEDDTAENAKFNFAKYQSDNDISGIDCIVFFLGMNGGNGSYIYKMIYGDDNVTVVSSIRDVLPDVPIVINMVPSYWGHANISKIDKLNGQNNRITQNVNYFSLFEGKSNVRIVANNGYNRIYGYRSQESTLSLFENGELRDDVAIPKEVIKYDHHPSTFGIHSLAYQMYNSMFL